jgi:alkylation response protein AidB-like acyl-CoA dehydrogenase
MTERKDGGVRFDWTELTPAELSLQAEVRAFLAAELGAEPDRRPGLGMNGAASREFSRKLGARGWLGMALPNGTAAPSAAQSTDSSSPRNCSATARRSVTTGLPTGRPAR